MIPVTERNLFMRYASPNERRTISREDLDYYRSVFVGAVYEFGDGGVDLRSPRSFLWPLQRCVDEHPFLGVVVKDAHTEKPFYERVATIDLEHHVIVADDINAGVDGGEIKALEAATASIIDKPVPTNRPPWGIVVFPMALSPKASATRCFIAFYFSHTLSDAVAGLAFHRTFANALRQIEQHRESVTTVTPRGTLPAPFDTAERLPISWGFLLGPLIALLLPKFMANLLGFRATTTTADPGTWTGTPMFFKPGGCGTGLKMLEIEEPLVRKALQVARRHDAKLTAVLHHLIVRALSRAIPDRDVTNFVSGTPVNMRSSIGAPQEEMGLFVTGYFDVHPRVDSSRPLSEHGWEAAGSMTKKLAEVSTTLTDLTIGLLRYAPNIRKYLSGKIGQQRDSSYEVSNLLAFSDTEQNEQCKITKMVFTQPGGAVTAPLVFSVVSVKGGSLVCAANWQLGALGLTEGSEDQFVEEICASLKADLASLE